MRLVLVFILETHNQMNNKCLRRFVQTDYAFLAYWSMIRKTIFLFRTVNRDLLSLVFAFLKVMK